MDKRQKASITRVVQELSSIQVFRRRSLIQDSRENGVSQGTRRLNIARPSGSNPTEMAVLASKGTLHTLGPIPPSMTTRVIGKEVDLGPICNF